MQKKENPIGRAFILSCGDGKKIQKKTYVCMHSGMEKWICTECHAQACKEWYNHGFEDAKAGKRRYFAKGKKSHISVRERVEK